MSQRPDPTLVREPFAIPSSFRGRTRWDFAFGEWRVSLNLETGKLEVARANRPDLAHLTISWRNRSESLDVHLTYGHEQASRGEGSKNWDPIFSRPLAEMGRLVESMFVAMRDFYEFAALVHKRYRPGWLRDHGYLVTFMPRERVRVMFEKGLPRWRGKYRLQVENVFNDEVFPGPPKYLNPSVLRHLDRNLISMPVFARRRNEPGKHSANMIFLSWRLAGNGRWGWWGISRRDQDRLDLRFARLLSDRVLPFVTPIHTELAKKIVDGLGLDEHLETQALARDIRVFFCERRNPYEPTSVRKVGGPTVMESTAR